jgi:hypothetical protein
LPAGLLHVVWLPRLIGPDSRVDSVVLRQVYGRQLQ